MRDFNNLYRLIEESAPAVDHVAQALRDPSKYYLRVYTRENLDWYGGPTTSRDGDITLKGSDPRALDDYVKVYGSDLEDLVDAFEKVGEEIEEIDFS